MNSQIFPHIRTHLRRRGRPSFFPSAQSVLGESVPLMRERLRGGPNEKAFSTGGPAAQCGHRAGLAGQAQPATFFPRWRSLELRLASVVRKTPANR